MAKAHKLKFGRNSVSATVPVTLDSTLAVTGATTVTGNVSKLASHGSAITIKTNEGIATSLTEGNITATIADVIPAGSLVLAITLRVVETIVMTTGVNFDVGVSGATTRYGENVLLAAGTTTDFTDVLAASSPMYYVSETDLLLTGNAGTFTGGAGNGQVRWKVFYIDVTAPTS